MKPTRASLTVVILLALTSCASKPTATAPTTTNAVGTGLEPLFPFGSLQEVAEWQAGGGPVHQPWRLDAGRTALAFTHFLGYSDVDRVLSVSNDARGAHATVGFRA